MSQLTHLSGLYSLLEEQ